MSRYRVFGGRLESDLPFPDLPEEPSRECMAADGTRAWRLTLDSGPPALPDASPVGRDSVEPGVSVRLFREGEDFRLVYDDTGDFRVSGDGTSVVWTPPSGEDPPNRDAVRLDVLGRVLPLALHRAGTLTFHASAVTADGVAVGFMGPRGSGKTTVALRLVEAGARLLTDDALPVEAGRPPLACPGVPRLRVRGNGDPGTGATGYDARRIVVPDGDATSGPAPLEALYLLVPVSRDEADEADAPIRRRRLSTPRGAAAMLGQLKLGPLLPDRADGDLLERCASLADTTAVYALEVPREGGDPGRLVAFLREHHPSIGREQRGRARAD